MKKKKSEQAFTPSGSDKNICANCGKEKHAHYVGATSALFGNKKISDYDKPFYCA